MKSLSQPTFEDVWKLFQESSKEMREMRERSEEHERKLREKAEAHERELREKAEAHERELRERSEEHERKYREEMLARDRRVDLEFKRVSESIGRLSNRLGDFVEEMVRPAAVRLFRERGIDVHEVHQNVCAQRNGEGIEVDLLVVNDSDVIAIECKSNLGIDDVKEHLLRLAKLKRLLPSYANKRVMGAVTGMVLPDNVAQYAYRQGLFVIAQTGNHLVVQNDASFQAKIW